MLSASPCKTFVDQEVKKAKGEYDEVVTAAREMWQAVNTSKAVSTTEGFSLRRTILGVIAAPSLGFITARRFLGGTLKPRSFREAKERRATMLAGSDFGAL